MEIGDRITVGDVHEGSAVAVGRGARAETHIDKIVNNIGAFVQRALTAAEEAEQNRAFEAQRLAYGVSAFAQRLQARASEPSGADTAGPYRGLLEYRLSDAELFFGRDRAIRGLLQHLQRGPLTVLHAESGAGKTSLLQAGISPCLIANGHLPVYLRPYNVEPSLALKRAFLPDLGHAPGLVTATLRDFLWHVGEVLGLGTTLYVFLDQFEEFFTQLDEPARDEFVGKLAGCLDDESLNVRWVLAIRTEFFGNLANFRPRIRNPFENDCRLNRLTRAEAREVVTEPARRYGVDFEAGLVDTLLDDLGQDEVAPPQVQLVCLDLYEALPSGEAMIITRALYDAQGGAAGILQGHLGRVLKRDLPADQRAPARLLLEALITSDGRRVLRPRAELVAGLAPRGIMPETLDTILSQLVDSRLLRVQEVGAELAYELAHDYLVDQIELSPEVKARKAAQELLEREVLNWKLFGALMRTRTLRVVGAQREVLQIGGTASELLVKSAFETDVDLANWLAYVSPELARETLLDGLERPEPRLRARAACHLVGYFDAEAESRMFQCALHDDERVVRDAAFEALARLAPDKARQVLLASLVHPEAARRVQAARALRLYLDAQVAERLFSRVLRDEDEDVWGAALETLATDEAVPHRANWRPLLKARIWRQAAAYEKLRRLRVGLPRSLRWRMAPARAAHYVRREARTRPLWLLARVILIVALYFGLAWIQGWPPFLRWERVTGAPQERLRALEVVDGRIYVGSFDYGLARRNTGGDWSDWLHEGLPTSTPAKFNDPDSNVRTIDAIAADPADPDRVYILVRKNGLFLSEDAGETWIPVEAGEVPTDSLGLELDVMDEIILIAAGKEGLYGSGNDGQTWHKLSGENELPDGEFKTVRFDPAGVPYAGGADGLYCGRGTFPWVWEKVAGVPAVHYLDFGPDQCLYLALGVGRATNAACYTPEGGLGRLMDFGDHVITALTADPDDPSLFYVGTIDQIHELECEGRSREMGQVPLVRGVSGLTLLPAAGDGYVLVQANGAGLYQRPP